MYKWHVHSAIGHGRPLAGDLSKVADGIASSLRQFHISASAQAENGGDQAPPSRTQRATAAAAEIASFTPRAVDARSLAAKPPPRYNMRPWSGPSMSRGSGRGRPGGMRGGRGRGGRGRGGDREGGGGRRKRGRRDDDLMPSGTKYTKEEQAYLNGIAMGVLTPAPVGITTRESLQEVVPALATSATSIGLTATIRDRMRALSGHHGNEYLGSEQHGEHYLKGHATFFVDEDDKARATGPDRVAGAPREYNTLDESERQVLWKILVAGEYQPIKAATLGQTVDNAESYGQRNESYLQKDISTLAAKVQKMLPAMKPAKPTGEKGTL